MNDNILNLISKLVEGVFLKPREGDKNPQKPVYKPINAHFNEKQGQKPREGGGLSPKQSLIEMLRRHDALSKKIDGRD